MSSIAHRHGSALGHALRKLGQGGLVAVTLLTLMGKGPEPDDKKVVLGDQCTIGVASGFNGDIGWSSADGRVGNGADGKGGVGIGVSASLGPVVGATVTVTRGDGSVLGQALTDASGRVTLTTCDQAGPFYVEARGSTGATMFDETAGPSGAAVAFGSDQVMRAYVAAIGANIGVSPFSEAAARSASAKAARPTAADIAAADAGVLTAVRALLPDTYAPGALTRMPYVRAPGSTTRVPDTEAGRFGLVLGSIARAARMHSPTLDSPALAASRQLAADLSDGALNGAGPDANLVPSAATERTYDAPRLAARLAAALATTARLFGDSDTQTRVASIIGLAPVSFGDGISAAGTRAVRLRANGTLSVVGDDGADAGTVANDVVELFGASQAPASVVFIRLVDGSMASVGAGGAAGLQASGATGTALTPVPIPALSNASTISIGREHALARLADGTVAGWGSNARAQLGVVQATRVPQPIPGLSNVAQVMAIADLSFAVLADGRVLAWGTGAGSLGQGTTAGSSRTTASPVLTAPDKSLDGVVGIAGFLGSPAGSDVAMAALRADGTVWAWGENSTGGSGAAGPSKGLAQQVPGVSGIRQLVAASNGFYALDADGAVWFWGQTNTPGVTPIAPARIGALPKILSVGSGFAGLYQARLAGVDNVRWRVDGTGAAQLAEGDELNLKTPDGFATVGRISDNDVIGGPQRAAGLTLTGSISEPNRPVTVTLGNATQVVTASGLNWSATFAPAQLPLSGTVTVSATFTRLDGSQSAAGTRSLTIDTAGPRVTITDNISASEATGAITFRFRWDKPVDTFTAEDVVVTNGTRGPLVGDTTAPEGPSRVYTMVVTPPADFFGQVSVTVPAGTVTDRAGNPNESPATSGQATRTDFTPPVVSIVVSRTPFVRPSEPFATEMVTATEVDFYWDESVPAFEPTSISVTGGRLTRFTGVKNVNDGSVTTYRAEVELAAGSRRVTIQVLPGVADRLNNRTTITYSEDVVFSTAETSLSFDGGGAAGGANGDGISGEGGSAGSPGNVPSTRLVEVLSSDRNTVTLAWSSFGPDVTHYLILAQQTPGSRLGLLTSSSSITRIPAIYSTYRVQVPAGYYSYVVRACTSTAAALTFTFDLWGCRDSPPISGKALDYLKIDRPAAGDRFGAAVAMSSDGSVVAVAAPDRAGGGVVAIYGPSNNLQQVIRAPLPRSGDQFGFALAFDSSGQTLLVGAPGDSSGVANNVPANSTDVSRPASGAVHVFTLGGTGSYEHRAYLKSSQPIIGASFGASVALSPDGRFMAAGEPGGVPQFPYRFFSCSYLAITLVESCTRGQGLVRTFARPALSSNDWQARGQLFDSRFRSWFGASIALAQVGNEIRLVVGAPGANNFQGAVSAWSQFVNTVSPEWRRIGESDLDTSVPASQCSVGRLVAISGDGSRVAIEYCNLVRVYRYLPGGANRGTYALVPTTYSRNYEVPDSNSSDAFTSNRGPNFPYVCAGGSRCSDGYFTGGLAFDESGTRLFVGGPGGALFVNGFLAPPGQVWVYQYAGSRADGEIWQQTTPLIRVNAPNFSPPLQFPVQPTNQSPYDFFGYALAVSADGNRLIVGAPREDSGNSSPFDESAGDAGAAYRF